MKKKKTVPTTTNVTSTPDFRFIIVLKFLDMENIHVLVCSIFDIQSSVPI